MLAFPYDLRIIRNSFSDSRNDCLRNSPKICPNEAGIRSSRRQTHGLVRLGGTSQFMRAHFNLKGPSGSQYSNSHLLPGLVPLPQRPYLADHSYTTPYSDGNITLASRVPRFRHAVCSVPDSGRRQRPALQIPNYRCDGAAWGWWLEHSHTLKKSPQACRSVGNSTLMPQCDDLRLTAIRSPKPLVRPTSALGTPDSPSAQSCATSLLRWH